MALDTKLDTSTYILNRILIRAILGKTPYELLRGRKPTLDYFRVFGSKCFILNTKNYLTKFDPKSYEGIFLGYSQNSKAYIILNKHTRKIEESLNVTFDETPPLSKTSPLVDDDLDEEEAIKVSKKKILENDIEDETLEIDEVVNIKESRNHPLENVIGNLNQRTLRSQAQNQSNIFCFISTIEPKNVNEALTDESWIIAMKEELNQFIANNVWKLVAQGCNQQEGIDYDETYAPVARLESIRILLAYACVLDFKLFQMDVKSAFMNGFINEEYIKEMLKKFVLEDSKPMKTPMSSDSKLAKDEECESVDSTKYRGMIGGHRDHVPACLCHMLYCIETSTQYNLAFFILKGMERTQNKPKELLPYGMLLTRLFNRVASNFPELAIDRYILYDRVMHPLAPHYERKMRSDHGTKRRCDSKPSSSSTALNHSSSSHHLDENVEESSHSSTPSLPQLINSLSNVVPKFVENLPHESQSLNSYQTKIINHQIQHRNEHWKGLRSIKKALKNMMKGNKK
ncbi:retrovirus-related pol polyprotein from transposon TNT 1-94 [Tanacetum coccineum]